MTNGPQSAPRHLRGIFVADTIYELYFAHNFRLSRESLLLGNVPNSFMSDIKGHILDNFTIYDRNRHNTYWREYVNTVLFVLVFLYVYHS